MTIIKPTITINKYSMCNTCFSQIEFTKPNNRLSHMELLEQRMAHIDKTIRLRNGTSLIEQLDQIMGP